MATIEIQKSSNASKSPNYRFIEEKCARCNAGILLPLNDGNEWWLRCNDCDEYTFCYVPMPHQAKFHADTHKIKMYAGGFGSAKTSTCGAEFVLLALSTPKGRGLVGASTYPQLEQTSKKQIIDMMPKDFIESYDKKNNIMKLTNGYEILFRSFDDEQKLRSLNLAHIWMEEANGTDFSIFTQLQTRLRHHATDEHKIIISTNPDMNWVRQEVLVKSEKIYGSDDKVEQRPQDIDKNISTHVAPTRKNKYLPPNYVEDLSIGKPEWWIQRYLNGSFNFSEGAVYPNFPSAVVNNITREEIIKNIQTKGWKVIVGADFGIRDNTVLLNVALDPIEGVAYVYDEYIQNRVGIPTHAKEMKRKMQHIPLGGLQKVVGDPAGKRRSQTDQRSIFDHYAEYGIHFQPGDNRIDNGIMKVFSYLEMGKLKVLASCTETVTEHLNYSYKPTDLGDKIEEKPIDINNHTCDTLRYIIQELPDDPDNMKSETYGANNYIHTTNGQEYLPYALQDNEEDEFTSADAWYYSTGY